MNYTGFSCLIFEVDLQFARVLEHELKNRGFAKIFVANTRRAAAERLKDGEIDLLICHDDLDFVKNIRTSPASPQPKIPIIMLTTHVGVDDIIRERDTGVDEIVAKPASMKQVFKRIDTILANRRPFVESRSFMGPDRRRHAGNRYVGPERRDEE